jgi:uncharacterized heparinase superfamily protein
MGHLQRDWILPQQMARSESSRLSMPLPFGLARLWGGSARPRAIGIATTIAPLQEGSGAIARELYRGVFTFCGHTVIAGPSGIFAAVPAGNLEWKRELCGFSWLSHLTASGFELYREYARALILQWAAQRQLRTFGIARRVISFSAFAPFLLNGAADSFRRRFLGVLSRDIRRLSRLQGDLEAAIALCCAVTGLRGFDALRSQAFDRLAEELDNVILPDGGHVSRNPADLIPILLDLVPLRRTLLQARLDVPQSLNAMIERMLPMLRFHCHNDGGLTVFQGVRKLMKPEMRAILEQDANRGLPLDCASYSGYGRLSHNGVIAVLDGGAPARCFGPLAFELSSGVHRIVVNCGLPPQGSTAWEKAASSVAAHSTMSITGPISAPKIEVEDTPNGGIIRAQLQAADGVYERQLFLSGDGRDVRGEDNCPSGTIIRFHLHPAIKAKRSKDGKSVMLTASARSPWRFTAKGAFVHVEDSVYLCGEERPRRSQQITLHADDGHGGRVNWAFRRIEERIHKRVPASEALPLPL